MLAAFVVLLAAGAAGLLPRQQPGYFVAYAAILCGVLGWVCYVTGEPPSWRWGKK